MKSEYPYQLVAFIGEKPAIGEPVYSGENGWYPQIALKRRFKVIGIDESELIKTIGQYCKKMGSFTIRIGELTQPDRMPVKVLSVEDSPELIKFHMGIIDHFGDSMVSRFPERDGVNYLPHITAEWEGKMVVDTALYVNTEIPVTNVYLLKDTDSEDSVAHAAFSLE